MRAMREGNQEVTRALLGQLYAENAMLNLSGALIERVGTLLHEAIRRFVIEEKLPMQAFFEMEEPQYGMSLEEIFQSVETAAEHICQMRAVKKQEAGHNISDALVDYVNANVYDPNLSLGALGGIFGLSNASISRIFKNTAGVNFYNYVTEKRMRRAQELLRMQGYRPKEIVAEIGYDKEYSFKRAFIRQYGVGPKEYVENLGQGAGEFHTDRE